MTAKNVIRTPDERFANLPDFPFEPRYVEIDGLIHYVDQGQGDVILCLHGEPTWSFLCRKMIPLLASQHRVVAPDFVGFGRSDKFTQRSDYSFYMHRDVLTSFIRALGLERITFVVQDWGGLIGLTVATSMPERTARLLIMNTGLPTGDGPLGGGFAHWREFVENVQDLPIGRVVKMGLVNHDQATPEVLAAYKAPFPDASYKAGAAVWPLLVPLRPDDPGAEEMRQARAALSHWSKFTPLTSGGGGAASSDNYAINFTVGQTAYQASSSANYGACLGYWCGAAEVEYEIFLPLLMRD